MTSADFTQLLVAESEADGNTEWIRGLLSEARAKISAAKGEIVTLTNATLNGKTFERRFQFSALDVIRCCRAALKILDDEDDAVPATYPDFSQIIR